MKLEIHIDSGLTGLTFKRPSLVKPQFANDCDMKIIVNRFLKTGQLPAPSARQPVSGDFTDAPDDFMELNQRIVDIKNRFESEPLELREQLQHNVERYIEYLAQQTAEPSPVEPSPVEPPPVEPPPVEPPPVQG